MLASWEQFISGGSEPPPGSPPAGPPPDDSEALDAFSRVVVSVAQLLQPAVVNLRSGVGRSGGSGSGILFTPDGFILTNHHVIEGQDRVRVRLNGGQEVAGRVVGADPWTDLAL